MARGKSKASAKTTMPYSPGIPGTELLYGDVLAAGAVAGSYVIDELGFEGGFASVYRAHHMDTKALAAVKVLHRTLAGSHRMIERFEQEATALLRLHHPNVVEVYELGELSDQRPYIAMEWLEGRTLSEELLSRGPLTDREALAVMEEVGAALAAAHDVGIVHRDLKSENVVAMPRGNWFAIKLVDFGIAKLIGPADRETAMTTKTIIGSPYTMAPEQILGHHIDARTDIYAMGLMLYQLVTGRLPYEGSNLIEVEEMHLHATPPRASHRAPVTVAFDAVVSRCLNKEPSDRYASVDELLAEFRAAVPSGEASVGKPASAAQRSVMPGIACYVEVRLPTSHLGNDGHGGESDDALLDLVDDVFERVRDLIVAAGLAITLETATEILAAAVLTDRPLALFDHALAFSRQFSRESSSAVEVAIVINTGSVETRQDNGRIAGGDLLKFTTWPAQSTPPGVFATAPAVALTGGRFHCTAIGAHAGGGPTLYQLS